jgi:hypothetical protein
MGTLGILKTLGLLAINDFGKMAVKKGVFNI